MNRIRKIILTVAFIFLTIASVYSQNIIKYTSTGLNLRRADNIKSKVLVVIPKGTPVTIAKDCDCEWIRVSYKGYVGYVASKYLTKQKPTPTTKSISPTSPVRYYTNSYGERVQSPTKYDSAPAGATALCRDGTYSFSRNRRGTCSHHGGVAKWL
ncbi:MAG: DUF3761 domain-containing protein [Bacteroidales bacterium]|jgi:uncharacterized protein YgiM (DUF1202 family)|nr:DUF3761 domain-containing protein [Bacteroidales bacterium]